MHNTNDFIGYQQEYFIQTWNEIIAEFIQQDFNKASFYQSHLFPLNQDGTLMGNCVGFTEIEITNEENGTISDFKNKIKFINSLYNANDNIRLQKVKNIVSEYLQSKDQDQHEITTLFPFVSDILIAQDRNSFIHPDFYWDRGTVFPNCEPEKLKSLINETKIFKLPIYEQKLYALVNINRHIFRIKITQNTDGTLTFSLYDSNRKNLSTNLSDIIDLLFIRLKKSAGFKKDDNKKFAFTVNIYPTQKNIKYSAIEKILEKFYHWRENVNDGYLKFLAEKLLESFNHSRISWQDFLYLFNKYQNYYDSELSQEIISFSKEYPSPNYHQIIISQTNISDFTCPISNNYHYTALESVIDKNQIELLQNLLIKKQLNINFPFIDNNNMLQMAAMKGLFNMVQILLHYGADINLHNENYGNTALHLACQSGHLDIVSLLIQKQADIYIKNKFDETPFMLAEKNDHPEILKLLILKEAEYKQTPPLHIACQYNQVNMAQLFIFEGADVNGEDVTKRTPLLIACENGNVDVSRLLLSNNAHVDCVTPDGKTPLSIAIQSYNAELIKILLEYGSDIHKVAQHPENTWNNEDLINMVLYHQYGIKLIHQACDQGNEEIVKKLIEQKVRLNETDIDGNLPIHIAYERKYVNIVKLLINAGADINSVNRYGRTLIFNACDRKDIETVKFLIKAGADINQPTTPDNLTPLSIAYNRGYKEIVHLLLENKADINIVNGSRTIFHYACANGDKEMVELFIKNGANINQEDVNGDTPLSLAIKNQHTDVAVLLINAGALLDQQYKVIDFFNLLFYQQCILFMQINLQMTPLLIQLSMTLIQSPLMRVSVPILENHSSDQGSISNLISLYQKGASPITEQNAKQNFEPANMSSKTETNSYRQ